MTFRCPGCNAKLKVKPEQVGKRFRCPKCKTVVTVPGTRHTGTGSSQAVSAEETGSVASVSTDGVASAQNTAESNVPGVWKPGDVILDLYEVKEIFGEGGFGTVYRVHHRGCLRPEGVRRELEKMTAEWTGPPPLRWE